MSSVGNLLSLGRTALLSHQSRMETVQNNIANASTPGYRRQRVELTTLGGAYANPELRGVQVGAQESVRAPFIDRQLAHHRGEFGYQAARIEAESIVEAAVNPGNGQDLASQVDSFFSSLRNLSSNPSGAIERQDFIESAQEMTRRFSRTRKAMADQQDQIFTGMQARVDSLNGDLEQIAQLDGRIKQAVQAGQHAGELIDKRDQLIAGVSEQLSVDVVPREAGTIQLIDKSGAALVEAGKARTLQVERTPAGELQLLLDGGAAAPRKLDTPGGGLGGLLDSHNELLAGQIADLDQLAYDFANEFNAVHGAGVGTDGVGGRDFFVPLGSPDGAARNLQVSSLVTTNPDALATAADPAGVPGGNGNIEQMLTLQDTALSSGNTLRQGSRGVAIAVGKSVASASNMAEAASASLAQLESLEASVSGVSLEEEMVAMTQAQRAFEASMKLIQVGDEMFDTILSIKR